MKSQKESSSTLLLTGECLPDRALIGGKAWSIANMMSLGLRVPPAFVITAPTNARYAEEGSLWPSLLEEIKLGIRHLEQRSGRTFGGGERPLLVSVRSGSAVSMPGMMDTVLNLGINDESKVALARECQDPEFAEDTHRRFLQLFASIVLKVDLAEGSGSSPQLIRQALEDQGYSVSSDPYQQLHAAVEAVFQSWNSRRAKRYREHHGIPHDLGTAVTVQAMVFGNLNERSGTGVLFSRNPLSGQPQPFGEFLRRAQGEDVVSGRFTPQPLEAMSEVLPEAHTELLHASRKLEDAGSEVQDIEFTVEDGQLFILQSRSAKLAPLAAARTSVDLVNEGRISPDAALKRISSERLRQLLAPTLNELVTADRTPAARGEGACPGVGIGVVVADADEAEERIRRGERVVLARPTTSPNDLHGMIGAAAVITEEGGSTSHAAVVSRSLGVPCVVGCGSGALASLLAKIVTVDGQSGAIFADALPVERPDETRDPILSRLLAWASERTNFRVIRPGDEAGATVLDLGADEEACDVATIDSALSRLLRAGNFKGAKGGAIATDAGVQAALRHGLEFIVADPVLPPLLAAANAR
ncbi:MAG: pyruvate, phosphate dikinase [Proteobacteria bacterium]|nr:pyruvate, phosphate dikinase [Pseudomonadota bacterium]